MTATTFAQSTFQRHQQFGAKSSLLCHLQHPKGRVIANMLVLNLGDEIILAMAADLLETVVKRLKMFVLRAKVQFEMLPDWGVAASLNDDAQPIFPDQPHLTLPLNQQGEIVLPHSGCLKIAPKAICPNTIRNTNWHGKPTKSQAATHGCAATTETCVAQMLNQHTIGGVHFRKGCYPGQEIIARAQYRGQVKRGLAVAENATPQTIGAEVKDENGTEVGLVLNVSGSLNLLVVKHGAVQSKMFDENGNKFAVQKIF